LKKDKKVLYSSHIFMFPFRFDWNAKGFNKEYGFYKEESISERISLKNLHEKLTKDWNYKAFKVTDDYNEYAYFYDYARDAIYNFNEKFDENAISYYYDKDGLKGDSFELHIKGEVYNLTIAGVSLRIFSTGVALLSLELNNYNYDSFPDILKINDFGRRIYPQFISDGKVEATQDSFLAKSIKIPALKIEENFERDVYDETYIGQHIMALLGEELFTQEKAEANRYYIQPSLDDRMFVVSWYGDNDKSVEFTESYSMSDDWYKYIFVDNADVTVKNQEMKRALLKNATYDRWSENGTIYGLTRYSFVSLTNRDWFPLNIVQPHIGSMYFQMMTLLLATRTSILRFSDEIAALASTETLDSEKLTKLYQRYLTFYNRLYFKEVTHQDQGIELYDIARKQMKIDEHMEKLDGKFTKLFEFAKMQSDDKSAEKMDKLTIMGAIFLPPSLMIALFSMGIFDYNQSEGSLYIAVIAMVFSILLAVGFINFKVKSKKIKEMILPAVIITVVTLLTVLVPIKLIGEKADKPNDVNITNSTIKVEIKK